MSTWKNACRVATTSNITLSGLQTIDGVSVIAGDLVLVAAQTTAADNGIYVAATGPWLRDTDSNSGPLVSGTAVRVLSGGVFAATEWVLGTPDPITLGTTALRFFPDRVPTITALRLCVGATAGASIDVRGYYTPGDGGGAIFDYEPNDTTAADDGGTIIVAGLCRYKRRYSGPLHGRWFGVKADGRVIADAVVGAGGTTFTSATSAF